MDVRLEPRVVREVEDQAFVVEVVHLLGNLLALLLVDPGDNYPEVAERDVGNLLQVDQRDNFHNREDVEVDNQNGVVVQLEVDHNIRLEVVDRQRKEHCHTGVVEDKTVECSVRVVGLEVGTREAVEEP